MNNSRAMAMLIETIDARNGREVFGRLLIGRSSSVVVADRDHRLDFCIFPWCVYLYNIASHRQDQAFYFLAKWPGISMAALPTYQSFLLGSLCFLGLKRSEARNTR